MPLDTSLLRESFKAASTKSMGAAGLLSGAFGFFADVLEPIAPIASYVCIVSLIALIALVCISIFGILKKDVLPAVIFFAFSFVVTGLLTLMKNSAEEEEKGVLATMVPALESVQNRLGLIQKDVSEIKDTTARTEEKVDQVLEGIDSVSKLGGIIANPGTPEEYYKNARTYEQGGDYGNARRSYLEYFKKDTGKLDPHLRFVKFLKVQEGYSGARETYQELTARLSDEIPKYVRLLLLDQTSRVDALRKYAEGNPNFAPVWYRLSREVSADKMGTQTMGDRRDEFQFIKRFEKEDKAGNLVKYIIDKELVSEWRTDAEKRRIVIEEKLKDVLDNPVGISWMTHNAGHHGNVSVAEEAKEIRWKIKGSAGNPVALSLSATSEFGSYANLPLPRHQKPCVIEITYLDRRGKEWGPFEISFNPKRDADAAIKKMIKMTASRGMTIQESPVKAKDLILYFSNIMVFRGPVAEIHYGVDVEVPNKRFEFPDWDKPGTATIPNGFNPSKDIPDDAKFVSIKLVYKDGEEEVIRLEP